MIINIDPKHIYNWKTKQRRYIVPKNVQIVLGYPLVLVPSPPTPTSANQSFSFTREYK